MYAEVDSSCFSLACSWNSLGETHVKEAQERRRSIHAARGGGPRQNKRGRRAASRVGHFVCVEISAPRGRLDVMKLMVTKGLRSIYLLISRGWAFGGCIVYRLYTV